ncbi:MAG: hypothetical protein AAF937_01495 [Planctomycetota bacterium]
MSESTAPRRPRWADSAAALAGSPAFQRTVVVLILVAGLLTGLETYPG